MAANGQVMEAVCSMQNQDVVAATAERVKNALSTIVGPLPVPPPPPMLNNVLQNENQILQQEHSISNSNNITSQAKRKIKRKKPESVDKNIPANVTVKNRFKHSKPMLSPSSSPVSALSSIAQNYTSVNNHLPMMTPATTIMITQQSQHLLSSLVNHTNHATSSSVPLFQTISPPMKVIGAHLPVTVHNSHVQNTSFPCPFCSSTNTKVIGSSHTKCLSCHRQYVAVTAKPNEILSPAAFYGNVQQRATNAAQTTNGSPKPSAKRTSTNKVCGKSKKKKAVEMVMVDLVSSDEEEKASNRVESTSNTTTTSTTPSQLAHTTNNGNNTEAMNPKASVLVPVPTSSETPSSSKIPPLNKTPPPAHDQIGILPFDKSEGEFKFTCNKAMFGELYGHTLLPTRVANSRIYLSLECVIYRDEQPVSEKYTLSVGHNDVQQVLLYFGHSPSFLAIETSSRFAEVACRRIGRSVLVPGSNDPKKRYIILALKSAFKIEKEVLSEINYLLLHLTSWAKVKLLSLSEAILVIQQANLDVCQKELYYTKPTKPKGPVETRLIFPFPPKTGGIPVTTEDEACLEEGVYLNDIIIDFYLKYLFEEVLSEEQRQKTYMFNSYFYKRLTQKQGKFSPEQMHNHVKKWTRNVDIFQKDFIIIPVNENCHGYLVIICYPGNTVNNTVLDEKDEEEEDEDFEDFVKEEESLEVVKIPSESSVIATTAGVTTSTVTTVSNTAAVESITAPVENITGVNPDAVVSHSSNEIVENHLPQVASTTLPTSINPQCTEASVSTSTSIEPVNAVSSPNDNEVKPAELPPALVESPPIKEKVIPKQAYELDNLSRPCVLIFDSLVGSGHSKVFTNIRHYLTQEWLTRKKGLPQKIFDKTTMKGCYPKVPRQNNDCDCGVFLLQYVQSFFTMPIKNYRIPVHLESWFTLELVASKRKETLALISTLAEKYVKTKR